MTRSLIVTLLVVLIMGCATIKKPVYFNDSDKIYTEASGKGVCAAVSFDCVVMSKGQFRNITSIDPELGKQFKIIYE